MVSKIVSLVGQQTAKALRDERGNSAVMLAIAFVPIMIVAGGAIDYSSAMRRKADLQATLDAGVLAAAIEKSKGTGNAATTVASFVAAKFTSPSGITPTLTTTDTNGLVTSSAEAAYETHFMKLFGTRTMRITAQSQAGSGTGTAEVVLVLDTTGSMQGEKLVGLQSAASQLVDTVMSSPGAASRVRFAVAPFATYVNIGTTYAGASWTTNTLPRTVNVPARCEDTYPNATYGPEVTKSGTCYNDGTPYTCSWTERPTISRGEPVNVCYPASSYTRNWNGCMGSRNHPLDVQEGFNAANPAQGLLDIHCGAPITRLTNNSSAIKTKIAGLTASQETYIAPGLLWGWNLLSPSAPFADGAAYSDTTRKVAVLMTDGANTRSPTYPEHDGSNTGESDARLTQICTGMKRRGIEIFTIAFAVSDVSIKNRLSACATDAGHYYDAVTISAMTAAFGQIAVALASVRLTR